MFAFLSQAVTGVFLAMYYRPSATRPTRRSSTSTTRSSSASSCAACTSWGSTVMVILVFLHMGRTFFFGAYKYPRELNWIIGVVLLILTMMMALTGYLLPFDQRSFWATVVGVNINASGPIVGPYLADFLRGGAEFGATTISRFYAIHMLLIPGLIAALIGAHLYLVAKLGTTAPPWLKAEKKRDLARKRSSAMNAREKERYLREYSILKSQGKPFFPYAIVKDSVMACIVLVVIIVMSIVLGRRARPEGRPDHHDLHAATRVVLLLPVRAAARDQAAGARVHRDDRHPDDLHGAAAAAAVLSTATRSATRSSARSRRWPASPRSPQWPT